MTFTIKPYIKQCVTFPYLLIVKCLVSDLYQTLNVRKANYSDNQRNFPLFLQPKYTV